MPPENAGSLTHTAHNTTSPKVNFAFSKGAIFPLLFLLAAAVASAALAPQTTEAALTDGLVGHWTFDGADTQTTITDRSGQNNDGYFVGGATSSAKVIGKLGQALQFDGANDYVFKSNISSVTTNYSVGFWMYFGQLVPPSGQYGLFTIGGNCAYVLDENETLGNWNNGGAGSGSFGTPLTLGSWRHITFVNNSGTLTAYVDGALFGSPLSSTPACFGGDVEIGAWTGNSNYLDGKMDDVRIYSRALTAAEVKQLYNFGKALKKPPNNLGLVGYWSFNEGTGTKATDFSGNGNTGTLTLMADPPTAASGWANGKRGKALNFDGSDDHVLVAPSASLNDLATVTVSAWIKLDTIPGAAGCVVSKGTGTGGWDFIIDDTAGVKLEVFFASQSSEKTTTNSFVTTGQWHHVVATWAGGTPAADIRLYQNGIEPANDGGGAGSGAHASDASENLSFGGDESSCDLDGLIDEVRVYNRVLSPSEVAKLYESGAVKFTTNSAALDNGSTLEVGLVGLWTFDGPDVTTRVEDRSGQGNNGYFNGATSSAKAIGKLGQALNFDGTDDYVIYGDVLDFGQTAPFTLSAWIKSSTATLVDQDTIFGKADFGDPDVPGYFLSIRGDIAEDPYEVDLRGDSAFPNTITINYPRTSTTDWLHVVMTYSGSSQASGVAVYENGLALTPTTVNSDALTATMLNSDSLRIGANGAGGPFGGRIDDVRIYNRALTAAEVKQLYQLGAAIIKQ